MRYFVAILIFVCGFLYAATEDSHGNLMLSPQEVQQTRDLFNSMNNEIMRQNVIIQELKKELEYMAATKCL